MSEKWMDEELNKSVKDIATQIEPQEINSKNTTTQNITSKHPNTQDTTSNPQHIMPPTIDNKLSEDKEKSDLYDVDTDNSSSKGLKIDHTPPLPPKSPIISSNDSLMNLSPCTSNYIDDAIYSDSEIGSQNSLELSPSVKIPSNDYGETTPTSTRKSNKSRSRKSSPRRESSESTPSPKPKKRLRRRSLKSDGSERSPRSSIRHGDSPAGSGYTLTPATGKVFRNLLILEDNLREQVFQQKALRRKYLTFLGTLCSLIASISYHLYFSTPNIPSESSTTTSGTTIRVILQFILLALVITLLLYHLSGEYQKTIVLPRKFLSSTNKGLRQLNVRLVKIKTSVTDKLSDLVREILLCLINLCLILHHKFDPNSLHNKSSKFEVFLVSCQLRCQPRVGIADVKLILNARVFNTDVREGWELYRSEFWIHEGMRRRNNLMSFVTGKSSEEGVLDREKLLKRDRKERRDRKRSNTTSTPNLNEHNLKEFSTIDSETESGVIEQ